MRLHYLRTKERREVDFLLTEDDEPVMIVEAKRSGDAIPKQVRYFSERYNIPATVIVQFLSGERIEGGIAVRRASEFLREL